jgi:4-diphosphocytidyl-2-C-methyl-D-erythritol kinase
VLRTKPCRQGIKHKQYPIIIFTFVAQKKHIHLYNNNEYMICFPNAKINLGLNVIARRADGYHDIETVFYPVALSDALEVVPAGGAKGIFRQTGIPLDGNPADNLVMKAFRLLSATYKIPETDVYLLKKIPAGAGLGGGSADAALMLKLLNDYAQLGLPDDKLERLAASLGADCAFFIRNRPAFASATGQALENVTLNLSGYHLLLVKPDIHISTREAYAQVQPGRPKHPLKTIVRYPIDRWKELMINDFEQSIFQQYPAIQNIKTQLYNAGAVYASMSGSGSAVFGIFKDRIPHFTPTDFKQATTYEIHL